MLASSHTHTHTSNITHTMENSTVLPVTGNCMIYEHEPLWIIIMVVMSTISTLVAVLFRKRRARASARTTSATGSAPSPSPRLGVREEEEEMV